MLKGVDFFCGAGGMTCGLLEAGVDVIAGIDNHLPCKTTYESNNQRSDGSSSKFIHADLSTLSVDELLETVGIEIDDDNLILAGCSPCQYWSKINTARERAETSKLLLEHFQRFVNELRPGYVVIENVPGLNTKKKKSGLLEFLDFLEADGYDYDERTVALRHYGVPQKRSRYLLIATRSAEAGKQPAIMLPEPDACEERFSETMKLKHFLGKENGFPSIPAGHRADDPPTHWAASLSRDNLRRIRRTPHNGGSRDAWKDDPELQLKAYKDKDDIFRDVYGRMSWDKPAPTITTRFNSLSNGRFGHPEEDRAISLREGATLQTFPGSYTFEGNTNEIARQIGNAVPPELALRIGEQITRHHGALTAASFNGQV